MDMKNIGHFNTDAETERIFQGMSGWQGGMGDWLDYYRLDQENSQWDDVFEEAIGAGRVYKAPVRLPCQHVDHAEGGNENSENGFYQNDDLVAIVSFKTFTQAGFELVDINTGNYLRDRVVYDQKVFRVFKLAIEGQVQQRDTIVQLMATQLKADELVDDPMFAQWNSAVVEIAPGGVV